VVLPRNRPKRDEKRRRRHPADANRSWLMFQ